MKSLNDISNQVKSIFKTNWQIRDGQKVPEPSDITLGNDAVKLNATVLYADLKESTNMVGKYKKTFSAEVYKSYLVACCDLIRNNDGVITSFDGDRVMAVFIGDEKESKAAKTALQINYIVRKVINPELQDNYNTNFIIEQVVGIDNSELLVAKTGIRGDNDLVWVGNAANIAAKMCSIRKGTYNTYISKNVYDSLNDVSKYHFSNSFKYNMWESFFWNDYNRTIYGSTYWWKPN